MEQSRDKIIVKTSIVGIIVNILLSVFKVIVGLITSSIAITLDAVNNISDAAGSIITIVGTKLAGKEPDKKHPFGYGRVEYFSALIISIIVFYAGITSLEESIKSILHPQQPSYSGIPLAIVAVAVIVKIILGRYFVTVGKKVDSGSLVASGKDATLDSVISLSTLVAAGIYLTTDISVEAYLGVLISAMIIKSGCEMLKENISRLLGERVDADLARQIAETIRSCPEISGVYDFVLNDYGPDSYHGSVHIEVPDTFTASELDNMLRNISMKVYQKHHVILTAIGVYSINTTDEHAVKIRQNVTKIALSHEFITQLHGFYLDEEAKTIRFDLVVSFDAKDRRKVYQEVLQMIQSEYPDYKLTVAMDTDFIAS